MLSFKKSQRRGAAGKYKSTDARHRRPRFESLECRRLLAIGTISPIWVPEGPAPITSGVQYVGAINQVAVDPKNSTDLLAATVNGGIWQTSNFTAPGGPTWGTTTDLMPSLSIESVAFSPVNSSVIYAGTGESSSEYQGDAAVGVYKSIDGGTTWQVENPGGMFTNLRIIDIVPTTLNGGQTVFLATADTTTTAGEVSAGGVYRSDDGGMRWNRLSGVTGNGLPDSGVSDLVENPSNANQFFAAIPNSLGGANAGVYELDVSNGNTQWANVTNNMSAGDLNVSAKVLLSISPAGANPIWAAIINTSGDYQAVYRGLAASGTVNWTNVGTYDSRFREFDPPHIGVASGGVHGAIVADPSHDNFVYLSASGPPIVRGDSSNNTWSTITDFQTLPDNVINTNVTTQPHMDSRGMVFAGSVLLQCDDGGVYQCTNPSSTSTDAQVWSSINGNIQDTEGAIYSYTGSFDDHYGMSLSYDSQFHIIFGGAQDVGTPTQNAPDSVYGYQDETGDDGGATDVDNFSLASKNESARYFWGHVRKVFSGPNTEAPNDHPAYIFPASSLDGLSLAGLSDMLPANPDDLYEFSVEDAVAGQMVVAGTTFAGLKNEPRVKTQGALYESTDVGSTTSMTLQGGSYYLNDNWTPITVPADFVAATAMAYGGTLNGNAQPDVLYVASGSKMYLRAPGGALTETSSLPAGAGTIITIALDPNNWHTAFVSDGAHVYMTTNMGANWQDVSGNLTNPQVPGTWVTLARLAVIPGSGMDAVLFAGSQGVWRMLTNAPGVWIRFGANLPNVETAGVLYNATDNVLVVSTIGRGFWEMQNASTVVFQNPLIGISRDNAGGDTIDLRLDPANSSLLELLQNGHVEFDAPANANPLIDLEYCVNDTIDIENVPAGVQVMIEGAGPNTVNINTSSQGVQGILGTVDVEAGGTTLNIDDTGDNKARTATIGDLAGQAGWGDVAGLCGGQIDYQYSSVASLNLTTDDTTGNSISILESENPITVTIEAVTNVYLGDTTQGTRDIADVSVESSEVVGTPDSGNALITVNDQPESNTSRTITLSTFNPLKTFKYGSFFVALPDTAWGSISGLLGVGNSTLDYEYLDTKSVTINEGGLDAIVNNQGPGVTPVNINQNPNIQGVTVLTATASGPIHMMIIGQHFGLHPIVWIGGVQASLDPSYVNTDTEIHVLVPRTTMLQTADVRVVTEFGTSAATPADLFTYINPPVVTGLSVSAGPLSSEGPIIISGTDLDGATAVDFGGVAATGVTVNPDGTVSAIPPPGAAGTVDVTVTTAGGMSNTSSQDEYTYLNAPIFSNMSRSSGPATGGSVVTIVGANLDSVTEVDFGDLPATQLTIDSANQITATSPPQAAGPVAVSLVSPGAAGGRAAAGNFTYTVVTVVSAVAPNSGPYEGGTAVTITGTGLADATAVDFGSTPADGFTVNPDGSVTAVSPAGALGENADVTVTTPDGISGKSANDKFTYALVAPLIDQLAPSYGPATGATAVTIAGANLLGATEVDFGNTPATSFTVDSATQIVAVSPPGAAGLVTVTVVTQGERSQTSSADLFAYTDIASVSPSSGSIAGGTTVTITGTNLAAATAVYFGGVTGTIISDTGTQIVAVSPAGPAGTVDVTVATRFGAAPASPADQFTYFVPAPIVASISPASTPTLDPVSVTITGSNLSGITEVDFGDNPADLSTLVYNADGTVTVTSPDSDLDGTDDSPNGTVDVTVVTAGGTSAIVPLDQFTYGDQPTVYLLGLSAGPANTPGVEEEIFGANLGGATAVMFGTIAGTIVPDSNTDSQITAYVPQEPAGTVDVTVVRPNSTSDTSPADQYTFTTGPVVTSVQLSSEPSAAAAGPTTGGTALTISGYDLSDVTAVHFGGTAAPVFAYDNATGTIAVQSPAATAGTVGITVTTPEGTSPSGVYDGNSFTYVAAPTVSSISPASGPVTGGQTVTIIGTFAQVSAVDFGTNNPGTNLDVENGYLRVTSPPGTSGSTVDVTVSDPFGTSSTSAADQYAYLPPPLVTGLSRTSGAVEGGTPLTISGTDLANATAVDFGVVPACSFSVNADGTITATSPASYAGQAATVDVTVTTPSGTSAISRPADQFTYTFAPVIAALNLSTGFVAGGTSVTISGDNFSGVTAVTFGSTPADLSTLTYNADGSITVASPPGAAGTLDVTVTTPNGTSDISPAGAFTYVNPPVVTGLSLNAGPLASGPEVVITGTDLDGTTAVYFGDLACMNFTVLPQTAAPPSNQWQIAAFPPPAAAGTVDVTVTTAGGTSVTSSQDQYTYLNAPVVSDLYPYSGPLTGGTVATIAGTDLCSVTEVDFGNLPATGLTINSANQITATSPAGAAGAVDVTLVSPGAVGGRMVAGQFTYTAVPVVSAVAPNSGAYQGGTAVMITGLGLDNATAVDFGGVAAAGFTINPDGSITAVSPAGALGANVDVTVTTPQGVSSTSASDIFAYALVAPGIDLLTPSSGPVTGATAVTITGGNLLGATAVDFGSTPAASFTIDSSTQIVAVSPANIAGTVTVTVVTPGEQSQASSQDQFTYTAVSAISGLSPSAGPMAGGTLVTISGTNLAAATAVDFGGVAGTIVNDSGTQIEAVSPARAAGTVDVTVATPSGPSPMAPTDEFTYYAAPPVVSGVSSVFDDATSITWVTITGSNLLGVTAVDFGAGNPANLATLTYNTDGSITVAAAPGPVVGGDRGPRYTVDVTVATAGGTSAIVPLDEYTYSNDPAIYLLNLKAGPANTSGVEEEIFGANLWNVSEVDFGGIAATIVNGSVTDSQMEVIVPTLPAGTVYVTFVATYGGWTTPLTSANQYTFTNGPVVTAVHLYSDPNAPVAGPATGGTTVIVSGYHLSDTTMVHFGDGTDAPAFFDNADGTVAVLSPVGLGTEGIYVDTPQGTSQTGAYNGNSFTFVPVPAVTAIGPASGALAGGQTVTIAGTFSQVSQVDFGANNPGTNLDVENGYLRVTSPSGVSLGTVDVTAANPYGTSATSAADQYTYVSPPVITGLSRTSGALEGGSVVTITGTGLADVSAVDFGGVPAASFTVNPDGTITATSPASQAPMDPDVTVTTPDGTSATSSADEFTYTHAPFIAALDQTTGLVAGGTTATISGDDLDGATAVNFGNAPAASFTYNSSDGTITAVSPPGTAGTVDVSVTTPIGTTDISPADQFTYVVAPVVYSVSPASGSADVGTQVVITGAGLADATAVDFGANPGEIISRSDGEILVNSPTGVSAGMVDVTVVTPPATSAISTADQFTYVAPPSITSLDTTSGPVIGLTPVTISGAGLANATAVAFGCNPAMITSDVDGQIVVVSPEATGDSPGPVDVTVTTAYGMATSPSQFTYVLPPDVTAISQALGPAGGGISVTISGDNLSAATAVDFGGVAAAGYTVNPDGTITATSPAGAVSTVDVTVTTPGGVTAATPADQFTYLAVPIVSSVSPAAGALSGGTSVTITGTALANATAVDFGCVAATSYTVNPDGTITATSPAGTVSTVEVTVTTPGGTSAASPVDQFSYVQAPIVSGLDSSLENALGGYIVAIAGTNLDGATEVDFGSNAGTILYESDSLIQAVSPAGAPGSVDVTVVAPGGTSATSPADQLTYVAEPMTTADSYTVTADSSLAVAAVSGVLANDTDPQGLPLTATLLADPLYGALSLNSDGSFTYTPNSGYAGADDFVYQAGNGYFTSEPTLVSVTVSPATLTWDGVPTGDWTDSQWTGSPPSYPDSGVNAAVDTSSVVQVTSAQAANALAISGGGQVAVAADASLTVTTDTSVTCGATLNVDLMGAFSTGGTLTVDTGGSLSGRPITAAAYQLNDGTVSADLSGPGGVTKDTSGTVIDSGINSYAGPTVINNGTFIAASALPSGTSLIVGAGGTFIFDPSATAGGLAVGSTASTVGAAAAPATSAPLVAASAVASASVTASALSTPSPAIAATSGSIPTRSAGEDNLAGRPVAVATAAAAFASVVQDAPAAAPLVTVSSIARDAVFTSHRSAFDPTVAPADNAQSAAAWAWFTAMESSWNSTDQNKAADSAVGALDKVFARFGV